MEAAVQLVPVSKIIEEEVIKDLLPDQNITAMMAISRMTPEDVRERQREDYLKLYDQGVITFLTLFTKQYGKTTPTGVDLEMDADDGSSLKMIVDDNTVSSSIHIILTKNGKPMTVLSDRVPSEEKAVLGKEGKWLLAVRQAAITNQRIAEAEARKAAVAKQTKLAEEIMADV